MADVRVLNEAVKLLDSRRQQAGELMRLRAEREKTIPPLNAALQTAEQQAVAAKKIFDTAIAKVNDARATLTAASATALMAIERVEAQLRRTADPAIDAFITEMELMYEQLRKESAQSD